MCIFKASMHLDGLLNGRDLDASLHLQLVLCGCALLEIRSLETVTQ